MEEDAKRAKEKIDSLSTLDYDQLRSLVGILDLDRESNSMEQITSRATEVLRIFGYQPRILAIDDNNQFEEKYPDSVLESILNGETAWNKSTSEFVFPARGKNELISIMNFPKNEMCIVGTLNAKDDRFGRPLTASEQELLKRAAGRIGTGMHHRLMYDFGFEQTKKSRELRHDLRNKIVVAGGNAGRIDRIAKSGPIDEAKRNKISIGAERICEATSQMSNLLDLSSMYRKDIASLERISSDVKIKDFMRDLVSLHYDRIDEMNYLLIVSFDKNLENINLPKGALVKLVDSYGGNGFKYTKKNGKILWSFYLEDHSYGTENKCPCIHFDFLNELEKPYSENELKAILEEGRRFIDKSDYPMGTSDGEGIRSAKMMLGESAEVILESGERKAIKKAINPLKKEFTVHGKNFEKCPTELSPYFRAEIVYQIPSNSK